MSATETAGTVLAPPPAIPAVAAESLGHEDGFASSTATTAVLLFPAALTVALSFNSGAFFPGTTALAAVMLAAAAACCLVLSRRPFLGISIPALVVASALGLFAGWTLLSSHWSHAPGRALLSYDRVLVYLLTFAIFASMKRSEARVRILVYGIAAGAVIVSTAALVSRTLPHVLAPDLTSNPSRLAYPLTYWNTLGLLAGVGLILCGHLACSLREPRPVRVLGAAAAPLLATTLFLTFSRGATWATVMGVLAYLVVARPRGALFAALATLPATVFAVLTVNPASQLTEFPNAPATIVRGRHEALMLLACALGAGAIRAGLLPLDGRVARVAISRRAKKAIALAAAMAVVLGVAGAVASGAVSRTVNDKVSQFKDGGISRGGLSRLLSTSSNGRLDHWRVALDTYKAHPSHGSGAGTFELAWDRGRKGTVVVQNAHSLYLETLAELGWIGMALLGVALLGILTGFARLARGAARPLYAALFACGLAYLLAAALDWDWQMPAVTLWLFAAGGLALARPSGARVRLLRLRSWARLPALAACVLLGLAPLRVLGAEAHVNRAVDAADAGDCRTAESEASSAAKAIPALSKPAIVSAYCSVRERRPAAALAPLRAALARDPNNWALWYDLAIVRLRAGLPSRAQALRARQLNAHDSKVQNLLVVLRFKRNERRIVRKIDRVRGEKALAAATPLTP